MRLLLVCLVWVFGAGASSFNINVLKNGEIETGVAFFVEQGLAFTALHVIKDGTNIVAKVNGVELKTELIGYDEVLDLALLKVETANQKFYDLEVDSQVNTVVKVGEKWGSIIWRGLNDFELDVEVVQGLSGSPVLCGDKACGLVTAFERCTGNAIAIKGSKLVQSLPFLKEGGQFKRKDLGVYVMNLTSDAAQRLGVDIKKTQGVIITKAPEDSPIKPWDIVTYVGTTPINGTESLKRVISQTYEKQQINIRVIRDRIPTTLSV